MTIYDYDIVMISVNIAALKAKLSFFLGQVKQGHEVLVMDRNTPIARMVSSRGSHLGLVLAEAKKNPAMLKNIKPRPVKRKFDVVRVLREERDRR